MTELEIPTKTFPTFFYRLIFSRGKCGYSTIPWYFDYVACFG
jgi:hypothetical protein